MNVDALLRAAAIGIHVFPCEPGGKRPIMTRKGRIEWGTEATTDPDKIRWWWSKAPDANVGVACKPSKLLVIDCDMPKPDKVMPEQYATQDCHVGEDIFVQMAMDLGVPFPIETFTVQTPSGGAHYYYWNRADLPMTQRALLTGWLDVRANGGKGGYVVGPGSSDVRGEYSVVSRLEIMDAPEWLLRLCARPPEQPRVSTAPPFEQVYSGSTKGLVETVRYAQEGNRNYALLWAAQKMAEEAHTENEIMDLLMPAAREAGLEYGETIATIRSGYRRARGG